MQAGPASPGAKAAKPPLSHPSFHHLSFTSCAITRANIKSSHPIDQYLRNYQASHMKRTTSNDLALWACFERTERSWDIGLIVLEFEVNG
jgi:hypothetical protein